MAKKYLLGLDLGTNSVGWCLTDENNQIIRKGGKSLWGVRLFDEANTAESRRLARESRRRTVRRAQRIDWLQEIFMDEINSIDKTFFLRLNQFSLHLEDKSSEIKFSNLFNDKDLNDRVYYKNYPTIYHLRKHLLETNKKEDIRLLYLAIAHMVKYRGNFIHEGRTFKAGDPKELLSLIAELNECINELEDIPTIAASNKLINDIFALSSEAHGVAQTKEKLTNIFGVEDKYFKNVIIPLIAGSDVSTKKIFADCDEDIEPKNISTKSASFDESLALLSEQFDGRPEFNIISVCKRIADILLLNKLLGSEQYLSYAMVQRYDQHKTDLKGLKDYVKENIPEKYDLIFRKYDSKLDNYVRYVGITNDNNKRTRCEHCKRDDFYKFIKQTLSINNAKKADDIKNEYLRSVYEKINSGDFLPRQNSTDNGVFPYQLNLLEMQTILDKQSNYYPFLDKKDKDGYTNKEKIISLLTFRIPYYVGPLLSNRDNSERGKNSWIVRDDSKQIRPWNFFEVVDKNQTAEKFIKRMLNHCSYLNDCYCLPLKSIMYQRYDTYNFLNKLRVNGGLLNPEQKEKLINEVFLKYKSITKRRLLDYFKTNNNYGADVKLTSSSGKELDEINCSLSSEKEFKDILGSKYNEEMVERIIIDLTIFEDKKIIVERLKTIYGIDDESTINKIKNLNIKGWGRLSKELLTLKSPHVLNVETGEVMEKSIIQLLKETNKNFMEILYDKAYDFEKIISERNGSFKDDEEDGKSRVVNYINEAYVSPGMKRSIIQTIAIIDDLKKIIGRPIDEYYIECTRSNKAKKEKTKSRKEQILAYYEEAKKKCSELASELNVLKVSANEADTNKFRSEKLWLYFLQMGKCAYSGDAIDIKDLFDDNIYDVDHIVPQSKIKDDSINNKVLVKKSLNNAKSDTYPLIGLPFITEKVKKLWSMLHHVGLMSDKKYSALIRREPISEEELALFVNRQIVFTNQAVKALADTINKFELTIDNKKPLIVYSKAENVSDFRQQFGIIKSRDANNFHHAHDAYLNVCIGRLLATYYNYNNNPNFIKYLKDNNMTIVPERIWTDKDGSRPARFDKDGLVWDYQKSVTQIKKNIFERFDIMVTTRSCIQKGLLKKIGIHKAIEDNGHNLIPLKSGKSQLSQALQKTHKYGGYNDLRYGFYSVVKFKSDNECIVSIIGMPNMYANPDKIESINTYLSTKYGKGNFEVLLPCVRVNTLIRKNKTKMLITGISNNDLLVSNKTEVIFNIKEIQTIKKISKLIEILKSEHIKLYDTKKNGKEVEIIEIPESYEKLSTILQLKQDGSILISPARTKKNKEIALTEQEIAEMFDCLSKKLSSTYFKEFPATSIIAKLLNTPETRNRFKNLDIYKKSYLINELLKATGTTRQTSDLVLIGGASNSGSNKISQKNAATFDIVVQSPTGYYEKVIWHGEKC